MNSDISWKDGDLLSVEGEPLYRDSEHSLSDGVARYPVIAEIPYLRTSRDELRHRVVQLLDDGHEIQAVCELLRDQDDWAKTPTPDTTDLQPVACRRVSLRTAMELLQWGPVADYFAYRWSDPTYLSGLALLDMSVEHGSSVFELACGIGHYCRELRTREAQVIGADVVFAKLYLARHYMCPQARLVCFDAGSRFALGNAVADTAFCHDAFYFLERKAHVATELRRVAGRAGTIVVGHAHNAEAENFSAGQPLTIEQYQALFPKAAVFDDDELTRAVIGARSPYTYQRTHVPEAISLIEGAHGDGSSGVFSIPPAGTRLRVNPLFRKNSSGGLSPQSPRFPSERYEKEYGSASSYLQLEQEVWSDEVAAAERGDWGHSGSLSDLVRRRIFVSLPELW